MASTMAKKNPKKNIPVQTHIKAGVKGKEKPKPYP